MRRTSGHLLLFAARAAAAFGGRVRRYHLAGIICPRLLRSTSNRNLVASGRPCLGNGPPSRSTNRLSAPSRDLRNICGRALLQTVCDGNRVPATRANLRSFIVSRVFAFRTMKSFHGEIGEFGFPLDHAIGWRERKEGPGPRSHPHFLPAITAWIGGLSSAAGALAACGLADGFGYRARRP